MGNNQNLTQPRNKISSNHTTVQQPLNAPRPTANNKKKVRFDEILQNSQKFSPRNSTTNQQMLLQVNSPNDQSPRYEYTESYSIYQDPSNQASPQSQISNHSVNSLRMTHVDVKTKRVQRSIMRNQQNQKYYKSMLPMNQKSQRQLTPRRTEQIGKSLYFESNTQNRNNQRESHNQQLKHSHHDEIHQMFLKLPQQIDDIGPVRLSQTNQSNTLYQQRQTLQNTQQTFQQIVQQDYDSKGYFILTDTHPGQAKRKHQVQNPQNSILKHKNFGQWMAQKICPNKDKSEQNSSEANDGCECNLFFKPKTYNQVKNQTEKF